MRRLMLKKDTLADLTAAELTGVVGAAVTYKTACGPTLTLTCWSEVDGCVTAQICA